MMFPYDLYRPWTSKFHGIKEPAPTPAEPTTSSTPPKVCTTTLHIARAIIAEAVAPFPEVARAVANAFSAYIRGKLPLDMTGDPSTWAIVREVVP